MGLSPTFSSTMRDTLLREKLYYMAAAISRLLLGLSRATHVRNVALIKKLGGKSFFLYIMPIVDKIQPIRIQQSRCIFGGIKPNHRALRPFLTKFSKRIVYGSMAWYKIFMQHFLVVYHGIPTCHLYFLGTNSRLHVKVRVYTEKVQVTFGIFHSITTRKRCITCMYSVIFYSSFGSSCDRVSVRHAIMIS